MLLNDATQSVKSSQKSRVTNSKFLSENMLQLALYISNGQKTSE